MYSGNLESAGSDGSVPSLAGTNGKGSVLAYTSMILSKAGYKTGRYVSPTVISYLEKIQIDGKWISESEFAEIMEEIKEAIDRLVCKGEPVPTVFEVETALAHNYERSVFYQLNLENAAGEFARYDLSSASLSILGLP